MQSDLTEIICIVDRSGSMGAIQEEAIGGLNAFLQEQADTPARAHLTFVQFDNYYEVIHDRIDIREMLPLDENTYVPRGSTALLDAIGRTIDDVGARLSRTPEEERPAHVIVATMTDGQENASQHYRRKRIRQMIEHQQDRYGWDFIFLAANQDAFAAGRSIGVRHRDTANWDATSEGTLMACMQLSDRVFEKRGMAPPKRSRKRPSRPRSTT